MTPKTLSSLIILSLFLFCGESVFLGGWKNIPNLKDPEVQEAAKFAVTEHNKEAKTHLVFESIESGEQQLVAGTNYRLVIVATDGGVNGKYEAVVWVRKWIHKKNLTSFKKL